jgi:hypothetical protein
MTVVHLWLRHVALCSSVSVFEIWTRLHMQRAGSSRKSHMQITLECSVRLSTLIRYLFIYGVFNDFASMYVCMYIVGEGLIRP